jgi:hypothetical protein
MKILYSLRLHTFARQSQVGVGTIYFAGIRDNTNAFLDGSKTYKLTVPGPVPARLFWSVTVYDTETRSQIATDQDGAAVRSIFEKPEPNPDGSEEAPAGKESHWVKTIIGKGWLVGFVIGA